MIFMQEKLAEMKSKFLTKVAIRVKPIPQLNDMHGESQEHLDSFSILNSGDMGLAKQLVFSDGTSQIVAAADVITRPSDQQIDFYDQTL